MSLKVKRKYVVGVGGGGGVPFLPRREGGRPEKWPLGKGMGLLE
jgi:hypothetical protein